jgi:hypothetical protein
VPLFGHGVQALGQQRQLFRPDGDFFGPRAFHRAFDGDNVAQVQQGGQLPGRVVHGALGGGAFLAFSQRDLHLAGLVADGGEDHLAHVAKEHDASGGIAAQFELHGLGRLGAAVVRFPLFKPRAQRPDLLGRVVAMPVRVDAKLANRLELLQTVFLNLIQHEQPPLVKTE